MKELIYSKIGPRYYLFNKSNGERYLNNISFGTHFYNGIEMNRIVQLPYDVVFEILKNLFLIWCREGRIIDLLNLCLINKFHMNATYLQMGYRETKFDRLKIMKICRSFKVIDMTLELITQRRRIDETGFIALTMYRDPAWIYSSSSILLSEIENVDVIEINEPTFQTEKVIKTNLGYQYFNTAWIIGKKENGVITYQDLFYPMVPICVVTGTEGQNVDIHSRSFFYLKSILKLYFNVETSNVIFTTASSNFDVLDTDSDSEQIFNFEEEVELEIEI
jgi:hypothetical protein